MKNVIVIGGTGFIGSNLIKRLINDGLNVYVLIRNNSINGTKRLDEIEGINYIKASIRELSVMKDLPQFDICFNLAAYGVDYSNQNVELMIDGNIKLLIDIIDFIDKNKTKLLVHTASCVEYGINESKKITEEGSMKPQNLYAASKVAGNILGEVYAKKKNIKMVTVRLFGIYGPGEGFHKLVPQLIESALYNKYLEMTNGEQIRDYIYIDDLIEAYIKLASSDKLSSNETYNICSANPIKIKDFVDTICNVCKCEKKIFGLGILPCRENEVMYFVGDNSKIRNVIDWDSHTTLQKGIELTVEWYRDYFDKRK